MLQEKIFHLPVLSLKLDSRNLDIKLITLTVRTAQGHFMSTFVYCSPVNCMIKSPKQHHQSSAFCGTAECAPANIAKVIDNRRNKTITALLVLFRAVDSPIGLRGFIGDRLMPEPRAEH